MLLERTLPLAQVPRSLQEVERGAPPLAPPWNRRSSSIGRKSSIFFTSCKNCSCSSIRSNKSVCVRRQTMKAPAVRQMATGKSVCSYLEENHTARTIARTWRPLPSLMLLSALCARCRVPFTTGAGSMYDQLRWQDRRSRCRLDFHDHWRRRARHGRHRPDVLDRGRWLGRHGRRCTEAVIPPVAPFCEARDDSHGNRNIFKVARRVALDQNGHSKTLHADPPTHRNMLDCAIHTAALCSPQNFFIFFKKVKK